MHGSCACWKFLAWAWAGTGILGLALLERMSSSSEKRRSILADSRGGDLRLCLLFKILLVELEFWCLAAEDEEVGRELVVCPSVSCFLAVALAFLASVNCTLCAVG